MRFSDPGKSDDGYEHRYYSPSLVHPDVNCGQDVKSDISATGPPKALVRVSNAPLADPGVGG